ncbi:MAG: hypothetical protein ABIF85_04680 [Nanoarchaeota archaeon]|nr:hypothetical protein [Nanoarchaeota archaeon]MBU4452448.1 hypothetical protein [Nanoarchaeota archaeon]MCG2723978.1 hypothetical protein [archaeon]
MKIKAVVFILSIAAIASFVFTDAAASNPMSGPAIQKEGASNSADSGIAKETEKRTETDYRNEAGENTGNAYRNEVQERSEQRSRIGAFYDGVKSKVSEFFYKFRNMFRRN